MDVEILYDKASKNLSLGKEDEESFPDLKLEVDQLNVLVSDYISNGAEVPPVPTPSNFNQNISKMVKKLYEGGVKSFKKKRYNEAVKQFNIGIEMILRRHKFEAFQGTILELSLFLVSRADSYLSDRRYLKAYNDADLLLTLQLNTPDNFLRRGVANFFLGNYEAAKADYERGLTFDASNERLKVELDVCKNKILEENGDYL